MKTRTDEIFPEYFADHEQGGSGRMRRTGKLTQWLAEALREANRRRRVRKAIRARRRMLDELDERTLKDIGLHRGELDSISAELEGRAAPTRRRVHKDSAATQY